MSSSTISTSARKCPADHDLRQLATWACGSVPAAAGYGVALAIACLISYWLTVDVLSRIHSLSSIDDLIGALWAVIATAFVYGETCRQSVGAA